MVSEVWEWIGNFLLTLYDRCNHLSMPRLKSPIPPMPVSPNMEWHMPGPGSSTVRTWGMNPKVGGSFSHGSRHFLSQKLRHFLKIIRSWVKNECVRPCAVYCDSLYVRIVRETKECATYISKYGILDVLCPIMFENCHKLYLVWIIRSGRNSDRAHLTE